MVYHDRLEEPDSAVIKQGRQDVRDRNCSNGKFGEGLVKAKLQETSETVIIANLIVRNLAICTVAFYHFSKTVFRAFWVKMLQQARRLLLVAT